MLFSVGSFELVDWDIDEEPNTVEARLVLVLSISISSSWLGCSLKLYWMHDSAFIVCDIMFIIVHFRC